MSKRGSNIWHRKEGRWEAQYVKNHLNGRAIYGYVNAKTYKEVKEKQALRIQGIDNFNNKKSALYMDELFVYFLTTKITRLN